MAETQHTQLVCYTFLCVLVIAILLKLKLTLKLRHGASSLNLPPGPWTLPVIGNMHSLLGVLPHQAMHRLAQRHGPVMLLRLGHVPTLVLSSPEAAREVMKVHDAAFLSRPVYATADIFSYGGQNIGFARHDSRHWKALRKLCAVELLSPRRVRSFRPVREEEAAGLVRSIMSVSGPVVVNVSERMKVMMNDVIMRVSVGDRCQQRAVYLEEPLPEQGTEPTAIYMPTAPVGLLQDMPTATSRPSAYTGRRAIPSYADGPRRHRITVGLEQTTPTAAVGIYGPSA